MDPVLTTLATYSTVFYQVCFPVAMLSQLRLLWLAVGVSFHLGILVTMGLVPFSIVMIVLELMLITDREYRALGRRLAHVAALPSALADRLGHNTGT